MPEQTVYLVGKNFTDKQWEVVGIYTTREKAIAACLTADYFVGPIELDFTAQEEAREWPGSFIPRA